jgi:hypothetical protein
LAKWGARAAKIGAGGEGEEMYFRARHTILA